MVLSADSFISCKDVLLGPDLPPGVSSPRPVGSSGQLHKRLLPSFKDFALRYNPALQEHPYLHIKGDASRFPVQTTKPWLCRCPLP